MYIALGTDCCVKKRMEEILHHNNHVRSELFDWVLSSPDSIIYILKNYESVDIFNKESWFLFNNDQVEHDVYFNKYTHFLSLHDVEHNDSLEVARDKLYIKYSRRLSRFIEILKSEEQLVLISNFDNDNCINVYDVENLKSKCEEIYKLISKIRKLPFEYFVFTNVKFEKSNLVNIIDVNLYPSEHVRDEDSKGWYRFYYNWELMFKMVTSYTENILKHKLMIEQKNYNREQQTPNKVL